MAIMSDSRARELFRWIEDDSADGYDPFGQLVNTVEEYAARNELNAHEVAELIAITLRQRARG